LLKEVQREEHLERILQLLGGNWKGVCRQGDEYPDEAIVSRHPVWEKENPMGL
jgi:hypothetical protein